LVFAVGLLILTPVALIACFVLAREAVRARVWGRPKPHLELAAVTLGLFSMALPVYAYGQMRMFYFMIDEECPARGAGSFVDFRERILPVSGVLECTDRTIQLVPAWVNPTLSILLALSIMAGIGAGMLWLRSRRLGPHQHFQANRNPLNDGPASELDQLVNSLRWEEVAEFFDPELMGTLPDAVVPDTSVGDWQAVLDLVIERGWPHQYSEGGRVRAVPNAATILARPLHAECPELRVWPTTGFLAIFRFASPEAIDFDVDLRELQGQQRLNLFFEFLTAIGQKVNKPVLLDAEGGDGSHPVLGYEVKRNQVVVFADPVVQPTAPAQNDVEKRDHDNRI
jgi:hypothetical protein